MPVLKEKPKVLDPIASNEGVPENWKLIDPTGVIERAGLWLLVLPELIGWYRKAVYTGHTLKRRERDWLLVLRCEMSGRKKVWFVDGETPVDVIRTAAWMLKSGQDGWRDDLY